MWRRYLLWFAHDHLDFRHAEMQSILSLLDIPIKYIEKPSVDKPYWIVELPSEESAKKIASRSVLMKTCIELWSKAKNVNQLHINLQNSLTNNSGKWADVQDPTEIQSEVSNLQICPKELIENCCSVKKSFKVEVETFCKHFTMKEKVEKIEAFSYLPLEGRIKLKNPDITLAYLEFYGVDPNNVPDEPHDVFFGRWVADGQRDLIQVHSLKKRHFIGNTSMDAQLAIIMANQAQVKEGDVMLDPFVGSGSLFVPAAHFGAYVWGSDIDFMMLHARTRPTRVGQKVRTAEESIRSNMRHYGSESRYLDVIVSDFSLPNWREGLKFDAIVTDPPYGVREPTEKIGIERKNYTLAEEHLSNHVPSKVEYGLSHLYSDLLNFAAKHLELGRRLVCWYPLVSGRILNVLAIQSPIMANQAQVKEGDVMLDPFVGSGSLFVPAAHFGAYVWGSDIDFMMLHARTRPTRVGQKVRTAEESIRSNMRHYGSESRYLDVIVSDFSLPNWREGLKFDAIVTDPPYGVREPTEKIGIERKNYTLAEEHLSNHVPSKVEYGLSHLYSDLLNFAAKHLELGRRLVCWYPLVREEYREEQLPSHPCLKLVSNSEQVLSKLTARRLLTFEKVHDEVPNMSVDPNAATHNFREKYFAGEMTRQERKEKKAEEKAANLAIKAKIYGIT